MPDELEALPDELEVLMAGEPSEVITTCKQFVSSELTMIEKVAKKALQGRPRQSRLYARAYLALLDRMIEHFGPGIPPIATRIAREGAANALVSIWSQRLGPSAGVTLAIVERLRRALKPSSFPQVRLLTLASSSDLRFSLEDVDEGMFDRFSRYVEKELMAAQSRTPLHVISGVFDLNGTELGKLLGVSRQAAKKWLETGSVPSERRSKVLTTLQIAEILGRNLKSDRISGIVRNPADWFDGKSILEMISEDRHAEVLDRVRKSFDWSRTA